MGCPTYKTKIRRRKMYTIFQKLFGNKDTSDSPYSQVQAEAMVDLLLLCEYADNHLSMLEENFIADCSEELAWDSSVSIESYLNNASAKVRAAKDDPTKRAAFISEAADRLESEEAKVHAIELCRKLFKSDGEVSSKEKAFESELLKGLGRV